MAYTNNYNKPKNTSVAFYKREANGSTFYSSTTLSVEDMKELIAKYPQGVQITLSKVDKTKSKSDNPPDLKAVFKEAWVPQANKGNAANTKTYVNKDVDNGSL